MINWDSIDTVFLDMDGTLLDLQFDNYFWLQHLPRRFAEIHQRDEAEALAHVHERIGQVHGTLNWYCVDYWSEQLQVDVAALKREIQHMIAIRPHVEEFLRRLHQSPRKVLLVTNAHRKGLDIKLACTGIGRWFDGIVVSHDLRVPKEDPQFWHCLHARHPFQSGSTLLIDDNETVLQSAQDYGIGHLMTLLQPDSSLQKRIDTHFPGIHHFDEIMPEA
ncbi:GMP/IMP nucleotidase [Halieaceae bacterium IMCC14734]|uniref:GMP/IMP nucleotidase n=1 Tax=Candidatus Litorirhabdus singularis TaxID=2518993 RepID=A0ABT3TBC7_9GAMM|nr:GMP/IMP nucleotidase [Candidatus Litorirhabdus singularis]MCX2979485.1 GMP/IMP nucleotidase [Candidatus Litorirhabdus singularis]